MTFTVNKDFLPDNGASVSVALVCTSGAAGVSPKNATEAAPAVFTMTMLGFALVEALALFALVIAFLLLFGV